jgi:predicted RNA-binding protein YlxR (DUF448 family)
MTIAVQSEKRHEARRPDRGAVGPVRTCIATRESAPQDRLIRFALSPGGEIVPDVDGKLPGRGFWLLPRRDIVQAACDRNAFAKAARRQVACPPDLADRVERRLAAYCLDLVGLARRSGDAKGGYEKARAALSRGAAVLLVASDAADGSPAKLARGAGATVVDLFDARELGRVFGRERTVYVAISEGRIAKRLMNEARKLSGFRGASQVGKLD